MYEDLAAMLTIINAIPDGIHLANFRITAMDRVLVPSTGGLLCGQNRGEPQGPYKRGV